MQCRLVNSGVTKAFFRNVGEYLPVVTLRLKHANFTFCETRIVIIIVRKTNKMHLYLINLFQSNYPLHVSNKPVHHQEVIPVHTVYSISHASMWCLAASTM